MWLEFSGKRLGAFGVWRSDVTLPPFHPNRITFERHFARECDRYVETAAASALHIQQSSADNFKRRVDTVSKSGTFVWYSGDTKSTGRGSLMVYVINSTGEDG